MDKKNQLMEDFEKKVSLTDTEAMEPEAAASSSSSKSSNTLLLLRRFLETQQRRAQAYAKLKQYFLSLSPFFPSEKKIELLILLVNVKLEKIIWGSYVYRFYLRSLVLLGVLLVYINESGAKKD
ncbi:hypothetical protein OIU78_006069 [Salix suchowensis]|nr:hypothetical protein OIU78_006069 [Salix suchowensis]